MSPVGITAIIPLMCEGNIKIFLNNPVEKNSWLIQFRDWVILNMKIPDILVFHVWCAKLSLNLSPNMTHII